jgi:hypothetical protein
MQKTPAFKPGTSNFSVILQRYFAQFSSVGPHMGQKPALI